MAVKKAVQVDTPTGGSGIEHVSITAPNLQVASFKIRGTTPLVQLRFSKKGELLDKMAEDPASRKGKRATRLARDYNKEFEDALHRTEDGEFGVPAAAFRNAMISACRLCGFKMTMAKLSAHVLAQGIDHLDGDPLVVIKGKPEMLQSAVRNATGVIDIRTRAIFKKWEAEIQIKFDADQFTVQDLSNLLLRAGCQVGVGEGRPDSKSSAGMGWGLFEIIN